MNTRLSFLLLIFFMSSRMALSFAQDIYSLHPKPKSSFERQGQFILDKTTALITAKQPSSTTMRAIAYLQKQIKNVIGDTLQIIPETILSGRTSIMIGERDAYPQISSQLKAVMPPGEIIPPAQGYILDVSAGQIILAGSDPDGTFNGVSTLIQLMNDQGSSAAIHCAHIRDYPDYPTRWVFSQHNLRGTNAITTLRTIADTMVLRKLNGFQQTDFKYGILQLQPNYYFDSVKNFKQICDQRNLEIVPGVANIGYSGQILYTDPNLAEGVPTSTLYIVEADTGRLIPDARVTLPNGGFESVSNNQFTGWNFYDGPNVSIFVDKTVYRSGATSARCENFRQGNSAGNARFNRLVSCQPFRHYLLSAYVKTQNLSGGEVQLFAYGQNAQGQYRPLSYTDYSIPSTTNGWMRLEVRFNTLYHEKVLLYCGIWGGNSGTLWWDDFQVQDAGLTNVLRRAGTPIKITNKNSGAVYQEGIDFNPIVDSKMQNSNGNYGPYHQSPTLRRTTAGAIRNGDTLLVSLYHPITVYGDANGNGSVMVCVSEDTLYSILNDQITRVNALYNPPRFFMGHDEIRNMNWDDACQKRNLSPAKLLSDNVQKSAALINKVHPGSQSFVWSDMFDSLHNARNLYYLVNGDLTGVWNDIPRSLVVANWNSGNMKKSLEFFSRLGFSQITSPYYDVGNTSSIRAWRIGMEGIPNVTGSMYTTWQQDYRFLTAFADYMWSAGPFLIHTPLDTTSLKQDSLRFSAFVQSDEYDNADAIQFVRVELLDSADQVVQSISLTSAGGNIFSGSMSHPIGAGFRYRIVATNKQGFIRTSPTYIIQGQKPIDILTAPILLSPKKDSIGVQTSSSFIWNAVSGATSYRVQLSPLPTFTITLIDQSNVTAVSVPFTGLANDVKFYWRVQAVNTSDTSAWSDVWNFRTAKISTGIQDAVSPPIPLHLAQNYPNPFSDKTTIRFQISNENIRTDEQGSDHIRYNDVSSTITLKIYDLVGREITTLVHGKFSAGIYTIPFHAKDLPDGMYIAQLLDGKYQKSRVITVMR